VTTVGGWPAARPPGIKGAPRYATELKAKVPVHVVARRLGYQDPAITLRVYAHVIVDRALDVADAFESALDEGRRVRGLAGGLAKKITEAPSGTGRGL
jgi:hypothetical protein